MSKGRLFLAGLVAGMTVFVWGMLSHVVLPIGSLAVKSLPDEVPVLDTLNDNVKEAGFYIYPGGMEEVQAASGEQRNALMKKYEDLYRTRPHGILIASPPTGKMYSFPLLLINELASNIAGGLIAAWLLSHAFGSLRSATRRVLFVSLLGVFTVIAIDLSYWNWYDFPSLYLLSSFIDNTIAWTLAGVVLSRLLKPAAAPGAAVHA